MDFLNAQMAAQAAEGDGLPWTITAKHTTEVCSAPHRLQSHHAPFLDMQTAMRAPTHLCDMAVHAFVNVYVRVSNDRVPTYRGDMAHSGIRIRVCTCEKLWRACTLAHVSSAGQLLSVNYDN